MDPDLDSDMNPDPEPVGGALEGGGGEGLERAERRSVRALSPRRRSIANCCAGEEG